MALNKRWLPMILSICMGISDNPTAQEVVLQSSSGENYVIEIEPQQSFLEVVNSINQHMLIIESEAHDVSRLQNQMRSDLRMDFRISDEGIIVKAAIKKVNLAPRNYQAPISAQEKSDIGYIVKTLSNSSLVKIKSSESSLKKSGDRIEHIHPFNFLARIFTDEELKVCIRNLQGRSWVWKAFLEGITDTLAEEQAVNNVMPYVQDFANRINVNVNLIMPHLQNRRWEKFVDTLIETVPRSAGSGRHDM